MCNFFEQFIQTKSGRIYAYDPISSKIKVISGDLQNERLTDAVCRKLHNQLEKDGLLCSDTFESLSWMKSYEEYRKMIEDKIPYVLLEMTKRCNLRCEYCAVSGAACDDEKREDMSEEILFKSLDFFIEHNRGCDSAQVNFYGGEALLRFEFIKKAVDYASERIKGKKLDFGISTNGLLLNEDVVSWAQMHPDVRFTCTLNGPYHDTYRKTVSGEGSLKTIMENLLIIKEKYPRVWEKQLRFMANSNNPFENFEILDFYEKEIGILPIKITHIDWSSAPENEPKTVLGDYKEKIDFTKEGFVRDYFKSILWDIHHRGIVNNARATVCSCFPCEVKLFVQRDGKLGFCEQACSSAVIGTIYDGFDEAYLQGLYEEAKGLYEKSCKSCWAQRMCNVCLARLIDRNNKLVKNIDERLCEATKAGIYNKLVMYCELAETAPELLKTI